MKSYSPRGMVQSNNLSPFDSPQCENFENNVSHVADIQTELS